jgi:hypothetical protein
MMGNFDAINGFFPKKNIKILTRFWRSSFAGWFREIIMRSRQAAGTTSQISLDSRSAKLGFA